MAAHMKAGHDSYVCPTPTCGKVFVKLPCGKSAKSQFDRHRKTKCGKPSPEKQYGCSGYNCDARFSNKRDLSSHEGKCEKAIKQCPKCNQIFKARRQLGRHKCTVIEIPLQNEQDPLRITKK